MNTLLICGSREGLSPVMLQRAATAVHNLKVMNETELDAEERWRLIVGDAPGIDAMVILTCYQLGLPFDCFGITPRPRALSLLRAAVGLTIKQGLMTYNRVPGDDYLLRDRVMVDQVNAVIGIWNGYSHGTKYTCDYARQTGVSVRLINYALDSNGVIDRSPAKPRA